jgi:hypothetical protein
MAANFSAESLPALVDGASPESSTSLISSDFPAHDVDEDDAIFASFVVFFLGEDRVVRVTVSVLVDNVAAAAAPSPSVAVLEEPLPPSSDVDIPVLFPLA